MVAKLVLGTDSTTGIPTFVKDVEFTPSYIPKMVIQQGILKKPVTISTYSCAPATSLADYALYYTFFDCDSLVTVDLSSLTSISGSSCLNHAFMNSNHITTVNMSNVTIIEGPQSCANAFMNDGFLQNLDLSSLVTIGRYSSQPSSSNCCSYMFAYTGLRTISLPSLTSITGGSSAESMFSGCSSLTSASLPLLSSLTYSYAMYKMFAYCNNLTSVDLSSLSSIAVSKALYECFSNCTSLQTLSFPSLTSTSFGSYTDQFNRMLTSVTGCTVHFPSNLQSIMSSWTDVTGGFGGTNTTVLFDLPATE